MHQSLICLARAQVLMSSRREIIPTSLNGYQAQVGCCFVCLTIWLIEQLKWDHLNAMLWGQLVGLKVPSLIDTVSASRHEPPDWRSSPINGWLRGWLRWLRWLWRHGTLSCLSHNCHSWLRVHSETTSVSSFHLSGNPINQLPLWVAVIFGRLPCDWTALYMEPLSFIALSVALATTTAITTTSTITSYWFASYLNLHIADLFCFILSFFLVIWRRRRRRRDFEITFVWLLLYKHYFPPLVFPLSW